MRLALTGLLALVAVATLADRADAMCDKLTCGSNSPIFGPYEILELDGDGGYNAQGLKIVAMHGADGVPCWPDVEGSRLRGLATNGAVLYEHEQLEGATIELEDQSDPPVHYTIVITHVTLDVPFWVGPSIENTTETYELKYYTGFNITDLRAVCSSEPTQPTWKFGEHYDNPKESVLFNGDRYDVDDITVTATTVTTSMRWFNIGCAGSAAFKMHMTRTTAAGSDADHQSGWWERQSMLKMYAGDMCGDGWSWTEEGTPLYWNNAAGWGVADATAFAVEALWDPNGVVCFDQHRLGALYLNQINACLANKTPTVQSCAVRFPSFPAIWPLTNAYLVSTLPGQPI